MRAGLVPDVGRDVGGEVAIGVDGTQTKVDDEPPRGEQGGHVGGAAKRANVSLFICCCRCEVFAERGRVINFGRLVVMSNSAFF